MKCSFLIKKQMTEYNRRIKLLEKEIQRLKQENEYYKTNVIKNEISEIQDVFTNKIDEAVSDLTNEIRKIHKVKIVEEQREDLFSMWVKVTVSSILVVLGIVFVFGIIKTWNDYTIKFVPILFVMYGVAFVGVGIDFWKEKDRKYVLAIVSFIVSLIALLITVFEKIG